MQYGNTLKADKSKIRETFDFIQKDSQYEADLKRPTEPYAFCFINDNKGWEASVLL